MKLNQSVKASRYGMLPVFTLNAEKDRNLSASQIGKLERWIGGRQQTDGTRKPKQLEV
ncbi:MAG TPA: hypothetical protein VH601_25090 [Bryobacteraceae bacterium]